MNASYTIRMDATTKAQLNQLSDKKVMNVSDIVRTAISEYILNHSPVE